MTPSFVAFGLLVCFLIIEKRIRYGDSAKEINISGDRSTLVLGISYMLNLLLLVSGALTSFLLTPSFDQATGWTGICIMLVGLYLRIHANLQLGQYYTRSLTAFQNQKIITSGLYRFIRHPGYAGLMIMWIGAGLSTTFVLICIAMSFITIAAYSYRIIKEEKKLKEALGVDYVKYVNKTKRIVPFLF